MIFLEWKFIKLLLNIRNPYFKMSIWRDQNLLRYDMDRIVGYYSMEYITHICICLVSDTPNTHTCTHSKHIWCFSIEKTRKSLLVVEADSGDP